MSRRLQPTAIDADVIDLFLKSINTRRLKPTAIDCADVIIFLNLFNQYPPALADGIYPQPP
jgi:hypothetical protein